ncbi:peptidoglycan D,D-transpeptidase FtsI family protein [Lactonifactor longoviformis]|uniref:peptidoglycan D,D-transpeptidase FtsI family protein n=1 Tax=Lactonifactor longoviformis TaxID=341220 RepID=UPI001FA8F57D|nr:penicillin-binding transpeptidase domain-containing protein [Lactonifactor longoviformis]
MRNLESRKREEELRQIKKEQKQKAKKKAKKARNREYAIVSYFFVAIFVALIGYLVYFDALKSEEFINSPYNKRQDTFADRVIRGKLLSADGESLAYTETAEDGSETRVYPYDDLFAHVVGYTEKGKSGLESLANFQLLTSHEGYLGQMQKAFKGDKVIGDNVITTLDTSIQRAAYDALGDYNGAVVVMEPKTGKILAMVSKPDFNPNHLADNWDELVSDDSNSSLLNRATQGAYPPGSTFKIVTSLAYLREHGTLDGYSFDCQGSITVGEHTIHCYNDTVHGQEDFTTAFAKSCNSAFAQIGLDLGAGALKSASEDLLFNKKLPVDLTYRKSRFSLDSSAGKPLLMQTSIGQGNTLVSPMHMALITSAVANEGELMTPYLIERVENDNEDKVSETKPETYKRLMSVKEADTLKELMIDVVENGTAKKLNGQGYTAAGKTGSAEYDQGGERQTHSWFVGFSNVEDPDIVVSVIAEGAGTGSEAAVPIARAVFNEYYY